MSSPCGTSLALYNDGHKCGRQEPWTRARRRGVQCAWTSLRRHCLDIHLPRLAALPVLVLARSPLALARKTRHRASPLERAWLPMNSIRSCEGGLAGVATDDEGVSSQRDAYGSCGFVGVRGGRSRDSERAAMRWVAGGGVILRQGMCACEEVESAHVVCSCRMGASQDQVPRGHVRGGKGSR